MEEQGHLEIKLKESGALLYLCGHEHLADCRNIAARRERTPLFQYVCGTGMDKHPNGQPADMVVFMGELDTERREGCIRAWEWRTRTGAWLPYQDISYKQTGRADGCHYFPMPPGQIVVAPALREEAMKRYRDYLLYECGVIRLDGMPVDDKAVSRTLELEKLFIPTRFEGEIHDTGAKSFSYKFTKDIKRLKHEKKGKKDFYNYLESQLNKIENGTFNQYIEFDLLEVRRALLGMNTYLGSFLKNQLTKEERNALLFDKIKLIP